MQLNETVNLMNSDNYEDRFRAEFNQLDIRINGLNRMLYAWTMNDLKFEPKCSYELLETQLLQMRAYRSILEERARVENIQLYQVD